MIRFAGVGIASDASIGGPGEKSPALNAERNEAEARRLYDDALSKTLRDPPASVALFQQSLALVAGLADSDNRQRLKYLALCNMGRAHEASKEYHEALDCFMKATPPHTPITRLTPCLPLTGCRD